LTINWQDVIVTVFTTIGGGAVLLGAAAYLYGDDSTTATNYPLVRIVNNQTNRVQYCRTHDHTTVDSNGNAKPSMGVATGSAVITTNVDIPIGIDLGDSMLFVVADGIPSQPFPVTLTTGLF
jgi:hypothetical protein